MARQLAPTSKRLALPAGPSTSYPLWLPNNQFDLIIKAQEKSGKDWASWISAALTVFKKEPSEEIEALLQTWVRERTNKTRINVRISKKSLDGIAEICKTANSGSKQACLQHALFMYALRTYKAED